MGDIIVGVDGSEQAQEALEWALDEARLRGTDVKAVYAYLPMPPDMYGFPGAMVAGQFDQVTEEYERQAGQVLREAVDKARARADGVTLTPVTASGEAPVQALIDRSRDAELLVVGTRGKGGFTGMLLGSVSQQVVQHAHCPVVVVGHGD